MDDKVSVIIPVYNAEQYIKSCLDSVLAQSYANLEIIVINDGSKDASENVICSIANRDKRIQHIFQGNKGVSYSRNRGLEMATGKYVVFVDADDVIMPTFIERMIKPFNNSQIQLSICGYQQIDTRGKVQHIHPLESSQVSGLVAIERMLSYRDITSALWNKMFILERIREYGIRFKADYSIGEDMVFLAEYCLKAECVEIVSDTLYCYRENPKGLMLSNNNDAFNIKWLTEWNAICEVQRLLEQAGRSPHMLKTKKIRIADKLLTKMTACRFENPVLKMKLQCLLRKELLGILLDNDFSVKKKISCMINAISPKLRYLLTSGKRLRL